MDLITYIFAGASVGFIIGLTGVGGGSLMTPLLILFGFPYHTAIGTDLLYAAFTKAGGVAVHAKKKHINWKISGVLAAGSLPAAIFTIFVLKAYFPDPSAYEHLLTSSLGIMLILTSLVLLSNKYLRAKQDKPKGRMGAFLNDYPSSVTFVMGIVLGVLVTLSSVGAGAIGTAILLILYPYLRSIEIVGTDLAHAVPLTLVAGLGHFFLGNVDLMLLGSLLIGSLPAIYVGAHAGSKLPEKIMQPILAIMLLGLGIRFSFF
ncbi:MAG: sulfite exporter TauE/SafE family protein [Pseudomonadales bacterium]|nr:sulfite exporter TauE/SafE family protein [Pseudomonadales bacterium]